MVDVVLGLQRGDEGKGRIVDLLAENYNIVARFNGGANAGHTIVPAGLKAIALHQLPSGVAYPDKLNILGNGVYLDPLRLLEEIKEAEAKGLKVSPKNLQISSQAHLVQPEHKELDAARENGNGSQGSTKAGIAFVAADKYKREGLRVESIQNGDLVGKDKQWLSACRKLKPYITDTVDSLHSALDNGQSVLAEGAQAFLLDIDHGMYPSVTSSHTITGGVLNGLGINHKQLGKVIGVAKVIKSHVGGGPFVTKIQNEKLAADIRGKEGQVDGEFGATTKRPRQVGYFDLVELRSAVRICGVDQLVLTKIDMVHRFGTTMQVATAYRLDGKELLYAPGSAHDLEKCEPVYQEFETWRIDESMTSYEKLPKKAREFVEFVERELGAKISMLGIGPERHQVIIK